MSEVVSRCILHRQLWVSNLSKVDSNPGPKNCERKTCSEKHRNLTFHVAYWVSTNVKQNNVEVWSDCHEHNYCSEERE